MHLKRLYQFAGICIGMALLWGAAPGMRGALQPLGLGPDTARAASPKSAKSANPCNPCNPNASKASNPCNPCAAKAKNPCNPCSPNSRQAANPCNPCSPNARQAANPCNPCSPNARQAANPCNPCSPNARQAANPCNPCSPGAARQVGLKSQGGKIGWGRDFKTWDAVTGYVISNSHGNRLVQTYIHPPEAARIYKHNAELVRLRKSKGFQAYPPGTHIVQESWLRNELGGPGKPGPVFLMRKEGSGYDAPGGDWHYGFTRNDLSLVGEGKSGKMEFCKECHVRADSRDFVYATDR